MIWQVENTKFFYFFKSTQTYLGRLLNASVYCERRLSKIARCANFANLYHKFLSRKLLSVDSFQKLDFHISWLTEKILDLLLANPALQDGIFNYLMINTFLFYHVIVLYPCQEESFSSFIIAKFEIYSVLTKNNTLWFSNKCFVNKTKI